MLLLFAWIVGSYAAHGAGVAAITVGLALVVCVFAMIVLHELGHALVARRFGIATRDILLLPIGGISSLERMPDKPTQELAVALVGPAINLVIAGVLWLAIVMAGGTTDLHGVTSFGGAFAAELLWINLVLAGFNLLPAFPMDGGRALRALLALRMGRERATDIAARLGKVFAVAIAVFGVFYNPLMILIAAVVWLGASHERALVHLHAVLHGVPVSAAMFRRVDGVTFDQPVEDAAVLMRDGRSEVPVVDHGHAVAVLTRQDVATALASVGPEALVSSAPHHDVVTVESAEALDVVLDRMRQTPDTIAVVVDHGVTIGLVTAEALAAYIAMHQLAANASSHASGARRY